jgi:hypothetical protein
MSRWTARLLVYFFLWVSIGPAAMAVSAPQSHACCVRKKLDQHHHHHDAAAREDAFSSTHCETGHRCCSPLTVSHWAQTPPMVSDLVAAGSEIVPVLASSVYRPDPLGSSAPARAPPSSIS